MADKTIFRFDARGALQQYEIGELEFIHANKKHAFTLWTDDDFFDDLEKGINDFLCFIWAHDISGSEGVDLVEIQLNDLLEETSANMVRTKIKEAIEMETFIEMTIFAEHVTFSISEIIIESEIVSLISKAENKTLTSQDILAFGQLKTPETASYFENVELM